MLYQMHEIGRAWMAPMTYWAEAGARMFSAQGSWLSQLPGAARVAAGYELIYRLGKDYEKPEFGIQRSTSTASTSRWSSATVLRKPFCRLLRFKRYSDDAGDRRAT